MGKSATRRAASRQSVKSKAGNAHLQLAQKRSAAAAAHSHVAVSSSSPAATSSSSSSSSSSSAASAAPASDVAAVISDAELLLSRAHYGEAAALLEEAVGAHPGVAALHDLLALSHVGLGAPDLAVAHLVTACRLDADGSGDRWMYLGQLRQARDALDAFEKGAAVYARQKAELQQRHQQQQQQQQHDTEANAERDREGNGDRDEDAEDTHEDDEEQRDGSSAGRVSGSASSSSSSSSSSAGRLAALSFSLSTAYVSMAELYVTDCCDEAEAEQRCETLLAAAMAEWPNNADGAYQTANLRLIQGNDTEAAEWLDRTLAIIERSYDASRQPALSVLRAAASSSHSLSQPSSGAAASYELRLNVAKLAFELGRYEQCARLLDALLEEDDAYIEVQHLAAVAHHNCQRYATALQLAHAALDMCRANTQHGDRREAVQLKPVMAALRQLVKQCEGKEDVEAADDDDDMDEGQDEEEEEEEEEEGDGEQLGNDAEDEREGEEGEMGEEEEVDEVGDSEQPDDVSEDRANEPPEEKHGGH